MLEETLGTVVGAVTEHSRITIAVMLVLSVAVGAGATALAPPTQEELGSDTEVQQKLEYVEDNYGTGQDNVTSSRVYVRNESGNVLSKEALLASLRFQRDVVTDDEVAPLLADDRPVIGVAPAVARRLAGGPETDLDAGIQAMEDANESAVRIAVSAVLASDSETVGLLPANYTPGTATAEARGMAFRMVEPADEDGAR